MTQVDVFYMSGERVPGVYMVWPNTTVEELANDIGDKIGMPVIYLDLLWHGHKLDLEKSWCHYEDIFDEEPPTVQLVVRVPMLETVLLQMRHFEEKIENLENAVRCVERERDHLRSQLNQTQRELEELAHPSADPDALPLRDNDDPW